MKSCLRESPLTGNKLQTSLKEGGSRHLSSWSACRAFMHSLLLWPFYAVGNWRFLRTTISYLNTIISFKSPSIYRKITSLLEKHDFTTDSLAIRLYTYCVQKRLHKFQAWKSIFSSLWSNFKGFGITYTPVSVWRNLISSIPSAYSIVCFTRSSLREARYNSTSVALTIYYAPHPARQHSAHEREAWYLDPPTPRSPISRFI